MSYEGIVHGRCIELDAPLPLPDGTRVTVQVSAQTQPRKGSPSAVLQLAGTLTDAEAEAILNAARQVRRIDLTVVSNDTHFRQVRDLPVEDWTGP